METEIRNLLSQASSLLNREDFAPTDEDIGDDMLFALNYSLAVATGGSQDYGGEIVNFIEGIVDKCWERLNIGYWRDIRQHWRHFYSCASFLKVVILLRYTLRDEHKNVKKNLEQVLETIDRGLLLGNSFRKELSQIATAICTILLQFVPRIDKINCTKFQELCTNTNLKAPVDELFKTEQIISLICPSIETFSREHFKPRIPVKLKGCIDHWPASRKWQNIDYILNKIGPRLIPVEIGSSYTSSNWSQKLMTVQNFINKFFLTNKTQQIGYLAQHQLFDQIPELLDDICEPDYCVLSDDYNSELSGCDINAWFGPANTISPLHYDIKHNFLVQVVGSKSILLVDPTHSENVYPFDDFLLFNTAQVDLMNPDYDKFPKFKNTEIFKCVLESSDMLYIPPKWWHHVQSLSPSFSVSFWWGGVNN